MAKVQTDKRLKMLLDDANVWKLYEYIEENYDMGFSIIPNMDNCLDIVGRDKIILCGRYWGIVDNLKISNDAVNALEDMDLWLIDDLEFLF